MPKIQLRHDTSTNWTTYNPILLEGEVGVETDTNKMKIGDGTTVYNSLDYFGGDVDLSSYYNKTETDGLLDEKEDNFNAITPLTLGIVKKGKAYRAASGYPEFTGDLITGLIYLFKNKYDRDSYFDATKPWELEVKNVVFTGNQPQRASDFIEVWFDTAAYACRVRLSGNTVSAEVPGSSFGGGFTVQPDIGYDFKLAGAGDNTYSVSYKFSTDADYIVMQTGTRQINLSTQYITLQNSYTLDCLNMYLSNTSFINNGDLLFGSERQLNLNISAGLTIQNGNLVNTNPTAPAVMTGATSSTAGTSGLVPAPAAGDDTKFLSGDGTYKTVSGGGGGTVDQTYDPTSTNAQSGTAVAEAVSDCVQNAELVEVQVVVESSDVSLLPSFYKVFSDGLCIQGGKCTSGTAVTFLKEFANTSYINTCSASASSTTGFTPSATGSYIVVGQVNLTTANS